MTRSFARILPALAGIAALAVFAAGCGSSEEAPPGAKKLSFELNDAGCLPHDASAPAGPVSFEITNGGSASVTELEVLEGETILGEREDITEGLTGSFWLTLKAGEYTLRCNGGSEEDGVLKIAAPSAGRSRGSKPGSSAPAPAS